MTERYERLIEPYLADLLQDVPAVALDGLKGVGKTVSAQQLAKTVYKLDRSRDNAVVTNQMDLLDTSPMPVLIDEWQHIPGVWDHVRRAVDDGAKPGSFLLTGSIANEDVDIHSGAGRILRLRMFPLSLAERGMAVPSVSLGSLLASEEPFSAPVAGQTSISFCDYMNEIIASGLPGLRRYSPKRRRLMLGSYLDNMLAHEFRQQGVRIRQPQTLLRWLRSYAAATATDASYKEILDASTAGESDKPAFKTTIAYREALQNLWLVDELPYWSNGEDYIARLKQTPRHYLADPALSAYLLGIDAEMLLGKAGEDSLVTRFDAAYGNILGRLFEALIQLSLNTYCVVNEADLHYLRTRNGDHEIDFIIQKGRKVVGLEVKLAPQIGDRDVAHLLWLKKAMGNRLTDAAIITTGPVAYRRPDGVAVIPAALLGA
jgi:predicted AAA+ superfamily ATPase